MLRHQAHQDMLRNEAPKMKLVVVLVVLLINYICFSVAEDKFSHRNVKSHKGAHGNLDSSIKGNAPSDQWISQTEQLLASREVAQDDGPDVAGALRTENEQKDLEFVSSETVDLISDANEIRTKDTQFVEKTIIVESDLKKAIRLTNSFGGRFYDVLSQIYPNFVFSPVTISILMALILRGSDGHSLKEIYDTMAYNTTGFKNLQEVLTGFHGLSHEFYTGHEHQEKVSNRYEYRSEVATSMWLSDGKRINSGFINDAAKFFHAKLRGINFKGSLDKTTRAISKPEDIVNKWLEKRTEGKVLSCAVRKQELSKDTELLFLNSIYFGAHWGKTFQYCLETVGDFMSLNKLRIRTKFLQMTTTLQHYESSKLKASIIEIPFRTEIHSLFIVLPHPSYELKDVEERIDSFTDVFSELRKGQQTALNVMIPKHILQDSLRLDRLLPIMGVRSIFNPDTAELTYISAYDHLVVNEIYHEAILEFKESGTMSENADWNKANNDANYTESRVEIDENVKLFYANRPHIFLLAKKSNDKSNPNTIMFMGRVVSV